MNNIISRPLLKENIKRFAGFEALIFFAYFLSTSFPIILSYKEIEHSSVMVQSIFSISFPPYVIFDIFAPIASAVIIFGYLTKVNSTTAMHTMPFSRKSLFVTNYLSGLILCIVPVIINSVILFTLKTPVLTPDYWLNSGVDVFTSANILRTLLSNIIVIVFTYSVSVLAGMISGNSIIHFLTACAMNFILPVLYLTITVWANYFLYGFTESASLWKIIQDSHPVLYNITVEFGNLPILPCVVYFLISIALTVLAYIFYKKRKLELAGDSYVFKFIKYIIAFIFTYLPATAMGMIFAEAFDMLWIGIVVGGIFGFIIGWMIVNKSFRVFNLEGIKVMLINLALIGLLILALVFDITGYERRIPDEKDIISVSFNDGYVTNDYKNYEIKDSENIKNIRIVHQELIDTKDLVRNSSEYDNSTYVDIVYNLKNGQLRRSYSRIPIATMGNSAAYKAVFESEEMDAAANEILIFDPEITNFSFLNFINYYKNNEIEESGIVYNLNNDVSKNVEFKDKLIKALAKDLADRTFEEATDQKIPLACISFHMETSDYNYPNDYNFHYLMVDDSFDSDGNPTHFVQTDININCNYENTIAVLQEYGLWKYVVPDEGDGFLVITKSYHDEYINGMVNFDEKSSDGYVVVKDSKLQEVILSNASFGYVYNIDESNQYWMSVYSYSYVVESFDDGNIVHNRIPNTYENQYTAYVDYSKLPEAVKADIDKYL